MEMTLEQEQEEFKKKQRKFFWLINFNMNQVRYMLKM
jgi:hypothetical protein